MVQYILRRIIWGILTLLFVSIVSFIIIELPPGDYVTSYIAELEAAGDHVSFEEAEELRKMYGLDKPIYIRYLKWAWGILHGDFGYSLVWDMPVRELIVDRLALTFVLSLSTLLFTWLVAIPIGIYSATHQYSIFDYIFTFFGFLGRAIPDFLLALVFMWIAWAYFGIEVGGLFSREFADAPWSLAKVWDMLKHIWIPMIVIGTSGTAGLIRIMRANTLDELHKPYVMTARMKGLSENRLLWKYPVRVALNPFISTVGWTLPRLISGAIIASIVLNLQTTGPMLYEALISQDMELAGSFILLLSTLTVIGTLISDILLAWVDPRIRYE